MTSLPVAAQFVDAGLDAQAADGAASAMAAAVSACRAQGHAEPARLLWVPGRLEVFGTHTDYAGGRTLIAALPRGFAVAAAPGDPGIVRVTDAADGQSVVIGSTNTPADYSGWRRYCAVVVERLARNFPGAPCGANIAFASNLPRASGMSSSSALIVGVAAALTRMLRLDERPEWRAAIHTTLDEASYYACIESGLAFRELSGNAGVGTHGGSEDHVAMLCGRAGRLSAYGFVPARELGSVPVPPGWRFVVMSSGVPSEKGGTAQAPYNAMSRAAGVLLEMWNAAESPAPSLAAALSSGRDAIDRLRTLVRGELPAGWTPAQLERRLDHFAAEDGRIPLAVDAFRRGDETTLDALSGASQQDAEILLGNQVPATAALARLARDCGAFASRAFGAGFGGSAWALVRETEVSSFTGCWLEAYQRQFPGNRPTAFLAQPGPPLTELHCIEHAAAWRFGLGIRDSD